MNGPVRIANQPAGSLEVELLRHARAECPPAADLARLAEAIGLGGSTVVTIAASRSTASASGLGTVTKGNLLRATAQRWLLLGGATVVIAVGVIGAITRQPQRRVVTPAAGSVSATHLAAVSPISGDLSRAEAVATRNTVGELANNGSGMASLAPEIELLDQARSLINTDKPDAALRLLDSYDAQFPTGTLLPEARAIRVQALLKSGKRATAVEVGLKFLSSAPASPHAHKIRQLLGPEADEQPKPVR